MAEDTNELVFTADMSQVNKALTDIEDKARSQPITLPVAAADVAAPGTRGAGTPNAARIMGAFTVPANWPSGLQQAGWNVGGVAAGGGTPVGGGAGAGAGG